MFGCDYLGQREEIIAGNRMLALASNTSFNSCENNKTTYQYM